ncbi:hypothetical protein G9A89_004391 [Geosiphon pyriformis]|nr:hypothetical protein G9A89_004391 [Geosiphon pyriformis]
MLRNWYCEIALMFSNQKKAIQVLVEFICGVSDAIGRVAVIAQYVRSKKMVGKVKKKQNIPSNASNGQNLQKEQQPRKTTQRENVFLFIPNLIGYVRVLLAIASLYYMPFAPWTCMGLYIVSCLLDAVDGNVARYLNQCSKFGAVLDMVTDRSTTSCLLCYLAAHYYNWVIIFQLLIALDLSSHYMHMYSSLTAGASSHKQISKKSNPWLRLYYSNNLVLFTFCALNELHFVALYFLTFEPQFDELEINRTVVRWVAYLSFPVCALKQIINFIQLANASQSLALLDIEERKKARKNA